MVHANTTRAQRRTTSRRQWPCAGALSGVLLFVTSQPVLAQDQRPIVAVLPVTSQDPAVEEVGGLINAALSEELAASGAWRVITADELGALLRSHADAQLSGVGTGEGLEEALAAQGAQRVIQSALVRQPRGWSWTCSLVQLNTGSVVARGQVDASSVEALVAATQDMAAVLLGRTSSTALEGKRVQRRLGLRSKEDLAAFRVYRQQHAQRSMSDALTAFILERNGESLPLAAAQAGSFLGAAVLASLSAGMLGCMVGALAYGWGTGGAVVLIGLASGVLLLTPAILGLLGLGATLLVVDLFNVGRVRVANKGCCRNDSALEEAQANNGPHRAAAAAMALAGPAACLGTFGAYSVGVTLFSVVGFFVPPQPRSALAYVFFYFFVAALPAVVLTTLATLGVSSVAGLVALLWPDPPLVQPAAEAP
jgi:hypothetical protein